jgi:arylformamidase
MAAIDYETEYNNRARVPEHPEIFARWTRDAEAYREEAKRAGRAALGLPYGSSQRQTIDLFSAAQPAGAPLAVFIHGGYWRSLQPALFSHVAGGLNAHGITVAVAGYDLCPQVRIGEIVAQMRRACLFLWRRFGQRMLVYGHSAGGHLAACLVGTDWSVLDDELPPDLTPAGMAISGLFDLAPLLATSMNADLRLDPAEAEAISPLLWPIAADRTLDAVVGGDESGEFLRQSRAIADAWGRAGATTLYQEVPGANHFTVVDPLADPASELNHRLATLAARVSGSAA